jgi:hypothetical protein
MTWLQIVLLAKICCTILLWSAPLLLAPVTATRILGLPEPRPALFARLLGAAFAALIVGYALGLRRSLSGGDAGDAVAMSVVSNGLAFVVLLTSMREWRTWGGRLAQAYLGLSTVLTFVFATSTLALGLGGR